ncbi:MAG: YegS/Rv2252/BmrU family lipid kinase [Cyanobacteria bacterium P01_H01_bin.119]
MSRLKLSSVVGNDIGIQLLLGIRRRQIYFRQQWIQASESRRVRNKKMSRQAHLIFNPASGQGDAEADLAFIQSSLEAILDLTVYKTSPDCDANVLAAQSVKQGVDLVIVSGGDGTVNAAAEALVDSSIPLAIIPRGTANAVASAIGIPTNLEEACSVALNGRAHGIDTALCNDSPMVLLTEIGLEAAVVERASRDTKNRLGVLAYAAAGIRQLREMEPFEATIETEEKVLTVQACAVTVANMAPPTSILAQGPAEVSAEDGLLDVTIVAPEGMGSALAASYELFRSALSDEAAQRDGIGFFRSKQVKVKTEPLQKVVLDGEILGETPVTVVCRPRSLKLILPQQEAPPASEDLTGLPNLTVEPAD